MMASEDIDADEDGREHRRHQQWQVCCHECCIVFVVWRRAMLTYPQSPMRARMGAH